MAASVPIFIKPKVSNSTIQYFWQYPLTDTVSSFNLNVVGSDDNINTVVGPNQFTTTITNLDNGFVYQGGIFQINTGEISSAISLYRPVMPGNKPGAPQTISKTNVGSNQVLVSWTAPATNGGSDIKWYMVRDDNGPIRVGARGYQRSVLTPMLSTGTHNLYIQAINDPGYSPRTYLPTITVPLDPYAIATGIKAPLGSAGMTILQNGTRDDFFVFDLVSTPRTLPFPFRFYGVSYTQPYFNSNTYITFANGSTQYNNLSLGPNASPALPTIALGRADNSWQRVYEIAGTNYYRVRYEGNGTTSGTVGSPGIVYEITFFRQENAEDDIYLEIVFGVHNRTTGQFGISNGLSSGATFTNFATLTPAVNIVQNNSYVVVLNSNGFYKQIYSGAYISTVVT